ncbi:MAG TPA: VCBS repeat-containing protein, partial [Polyangiales bacterium]
NNALAGNTHLLRNDDLVLSMGDETQGTEAITTVRDNWLYPFAMNDTQTSQPQLDANRFAGRLHDYEPGQIAGRFFRGLTDAVVSYPNVLTAGAKITGYNVQIRLGDGAGDLATQDAPITQALPYGSNSTTVSQAAAADFNGDGLDELVMVYADYTSAFDGNARIRIATAADPDDPSKGFNYGDEHTLGFPYGTRSVAAGDFNGDGQPELAVLFLDANEQLTVNVYSVSASLVPKLETSTAVDMFQEPTVDEPMQLATGNFTGHANQQLIVANRNSQGSSAVVRVFDFHGNYTPVLGQTFDTKIPVNRLKLVVARFGWSDGGDSIALMLTNVADGNSTSSVQFLSINPTTYAFTTLSTLEVAKDMFGTSNHNYLALDIAAGNFDNHMPSPIDSTKTVRDPNLQLAIATAYCHGRNEGILEYEPKNLFVYDVISPKDGSVNPSQAFKSAALTLGPGTPIANTYNYVTRMVLTSADLHGRSLRLGAGYRVTIDRTVPRMMLAQPPSHVDYAPFTSSSTDATLVNLSLSPNKFNASYSVDSSASAETSTDTTKGWSSAYKEGLDIDLTFGKTNAAGNLESGVKISEAFEAEQAYDHSTTDRYGSRSSDSQRLDLETGLNDYVWYEDGVTYVYVYDVIGQKVCPNQETSCNESDKVPLTIMLAAPGAITSSYLSGESLEWYQPTWENGNILSYPGNLQQLWREVSNPLQLNAAQTLMTDSAKANITTSWAGTTDKSRSVSSSQLLKFDSDTSLEGAKSIELFHRGIDVDGKVSFDYTHSSSLETLQTSTTTIEQSTGITLTKQASFRAASTYGYGFSPVIFAQSMPDGYTNGIDPLTPGTALLPLPTQINTFGPLRASFTVDPLQSNAGGWWRHTYGQAIDIALNHPTRYSNSHVTAAGSESNCIETDDGYEDCTLLNPRTPADPWDDAFHKMRGFFVYRKSEANPAAPNAQGMQQTSAIAGDPLTLEARVYNYSTVPLPAGATVKANFYAMWWNPTTGFPADYVDASHPGGTSKLLGTYSTNSLPAFNTDTATPNYIMAHVDLDTTGWDNRSVVFWVAVWAEDSTGKMLNEAANKGLTSNPRLLNAQTFSQLAALEP